MTHADVVVVAPLEDTHGKCVAALLAKMGVNVLRFDSRNLPTSTISWRPEDTLRLTQDRDDWIVDRASTVWWRRPRKAVGRDLPPLEARLVADEATSLLPGLLEAVGVRWVDAPWILLRSRLKLLQLAIAGTLGIAIPNTLVTSDPQSAEAFLQAGSVVAKALSTGFGIAPFVATVPRDEAHRVSECPALLQQFINAASDVRIVTVGSQSFAWQRPRTENAPIDWRQADPRGSSFRATQHDPTEGSALRLANALGLSFSVQDWLLLDDSVVFLEVNPQGQFLFLHRASTTVASALAQHLSRS